MLHLPPEYKQLLRELPDTTDNPFYWRERRRDSRRGEPWRGMVNSIFLLGFVFAGALIGLWAILNSNALPGIFVNGRIPAWLGGQDGGRAIFALLAGTHLTMVYFTARTLSNGVLVGEARRGTLFQLVMTRIPAFEMLLQIVVYPFQQAFLVAIAGLPFYALLMSFGSVGLQEVFVLYLIFLLLAVGVPNWRTPAFAEQSPEEVGEVLRERERAAGCAATVIAFVMIPGTIMIGGLLVGIHFAMPFAFSRVPVDVWPALPAFPITFAWVAVRLLTAPYTWFGLPLPPWVWLLPLLLLTRLGNLWYSSFYLQIAHPGQILNLADVRPLARWRAGIQALTMIASVGYIWQPLLETGITGSLFYPNAAGTPADNLAGAFYLFGVIGFVSALHRARKHAVAHPAKKLETAAALRWICAPFLPLALAVLVGAVGSSSAFFTVQVELALLSIVAIFGANVLLAASLGPGTGGAWQALLLLPLVLPLAPVKAVAAGGGLSPLLATWTINLALRDTLTRLVPIYNQPAWWASVVFPLIGVGICQWLWKTGYFDRKAAIQDREPIKLVLNTPGQAVATAHSENSAPVYASRSVATMPPPAANLDFVLPEVEITHGNNGSSAPSSPVMPEFDISSGGSQPLHPMPLPPIIAPPVIVPLPPTLQLPPLPPVNLTISERAAIASAYGPQPRAPSRTEWRWRPLSPMAAAVLRWLTKRTDNPVALYSARRALPGTLNNDQLTVGALALLVGLLVAYAQYAILYILVLPAPVAAVIYPINVPGGDFFTAQGQPENGFPIGLALLVSLLVGVTLLSPWGICRAVADGFRMERERSTLGFLLVTPLSSMGVAVGHCVGAVLPALTLWAGAALAALIPTAILATEVGVKFAFWGWGFGFFLSLMYLAMCAVTGMWIGITEVTARDMTIGVYLLPASFCVIGVGSAFYTARYWHWGYYAYTGVFVAICMTIILWLWANALKELNQMRHGDMAFEGRTMS
jgi:hypothetical protein